MVEDERKSFRSFKDLKKLVGGDPQPPSEEDPEPEPERGWSFETEEGAGEAAGLEEVGGDGVRGRVDARPAAFGPLPEGPPPYRDRESEELELLASFRVRTVFPADVHAEVGDLPADPAEADFEGREDLRGELIFTIDGEDAKDFDDAIGIRAREDGRVEIGVHIADVGHYVRPGTALDEEAMSRATSVYLPDQVVPMLPEAISNRLCSLVEGRDRLAYSVRMVFDESGRRESARVHKSVIRSARRCTYRGVQEQLDGEASEAARELAHLGESLRLFQRWTRTQQDLRDARGSLRIQSRERKFLFDQDHEVRTVVDAPRYFSQGLIEETALAANQAVGDLFRERGLPTLYRVHPEKDPEEVEAVARMLEEHGIRVPEKARLTGRDIGRMIRTARRRPNSQALIQRIMGLVERATYEVKDHVDVAQHFGLAREAYLHFTSPIRRYPDLMVHRWLWALESRGEQAQRELAADELVAELNQLAAHCSAQANVAEMAEQAVGDLKVCQYMHPHVGEKVKARVLRVSPYGLEVLMEDFNVTGFLPARAIGERIQVKGPTATIRAGRRNLSFTEGHPVAVRLKDVDFIRLQLMLELA